MDFLLTSVRKDLSRWVQDRVAMLTWLGIPLLVGVLITSLVGDGGRTPTGTLLIADEDETFISSIFVGAYTREQLGDLIVVEQVSVEEGELRINEGEASGFLTIPEGFQDAFLNETPVILTLKTNPAQTILPGIIEDVTEILMDAGFYAQRLIGPEIKAIMELSEDGTPSDAFIASTSVAISNKVEAITRKLTPLALEVEIAEPLSSEPQPDLALLFLPGIALMAVLFVANSLASDYWVERDTGTLRRLVSAPGVLMSFVTAKALSVFVVMLAVTLVLLILGFGYHGVAWSKIPISVLWVALGGVGLFAWFAFLQMLLPNNRAANLVTTVLIFPLMMIGGSFFPLAALPGWIADLGRFAPNGFVVDRLSIELTAASAGAIDIESWLTAIAFTASGLLLGAWRLRSGFARR